MKAGRSMLDTLHRHQLVDLGPQAWADLLERPWDAQAREILTHWRDHALPLVVARQSAEHAAAGLMALGLPAPGRWQRRRMGFDVARGAAMGTREFPSLDELMASPLAVSGALRQALDSLQQRLHTAGATGFVFGSHGWQCITGLPYLRPGSDIDLWVPVDGAEQGDRLASLLQAMPQAGPRVDAELVFPGGWAVAWREWAAWRAGKVRSVLVKGLHGVALREDHEWCASAAAPGVPA